MSGWAGPKTRRMIPATSSSIRSALRFSSAEDPPSSSVARERSSRSNYASSLKRLQRFREAKSLLCKTLPVARRVFGDSHEDTLRLKWIYAAALYMDDGATLDDLREAVTTLEELERTARRVFGGAYPYTKNVENDLRHARAKLRAREGDVESVREAVEAMTPGDT